jgi:hypothetical protein
MSFFDLFDLLGDFFEAVAERRRHRKSRRKGRR